MHEAVAFLVKAVAACLTGVENALQGQELINLVSKEEAGANEGKKKKMGDRDIAFQTLGLMIDLELLETSQKDMINTYP